VPGPEQAKQLVDFGSTVILVFLVILIFVGLFRRWWVPGYLFDELREDWRKLRDQGDQNARALEEYAKTQTGIAASLKSMDERDRDRHSSGGY
jgi:hypothetical protein